MKKVFSLIIPVLLILGGCSRDSNPVRPNNSGITINSMSTDPDTIGPGESSTISVNYSLKGIEYEDITFEWSSNGGSIEGDGAQIRWHAPNDNNRYNISVTIRDTVENITTNATTNVVVNRNRSGIGGKVYWPGHSLSSCAIVGIFYAPYEDCIWADELPSSGVYEAPVSEWDSYLPPGRYFVFVWDDQNCNGDLDSYDGVGIYPSDYYSNGNNIYLGSNQFYSNADVVLETYYSRTTNNYGSSLLRKLTQRYSHN